MDKIIVFTATYNEADDIADLIKGIQHYLPQADILVVDDCSPDGTGEILDNISKRDPPIRVIHRYRKLGLGTAHKLAMKYALMNNYEFLITMDADFSHNPKYLPILMENLKKNDFVIGSRYTKGGCCNYKFGRSFISKTANILVRLLLGIKLKETTTSYRGFRKSLIERLNIDHIKSEGYSFFFECTYQISNITKKLAEFPIYFDDRRSGTSKILKIEVMKGMIVLLKLFLMRIFNIKTKTIQIIYPETYKIIDCNICNLPYHVEIYPSASSTVQDKSMYKCTSTHHDSHDRIVKCLSCGTIFSNPQLAEDKVHEFYANVEDAAYLENLEGRFRTFQYNLNKIMKYLPASGKLLEVGSYYGAFLKIANDSGFDSIGIEPCSFAVDYSINHFGLKAIQGTLLDLPENLKDFDIIASWDVLEHLINPMKELKLMNTKLKKGGILVFSTLNIDNWYPKILGEKWPWLMNMHLYYFNENIIAEILRRSGFQVLYVQSYCHIISFDYFLSKLSQLGFPEMTSLRRIIARTPLKKIFIPFGFGDIKMYVCKKL